MDENNVPQAPPDDDRTPTQEDAAQVKKGGEGWVMPEPVFRKSSGYLPKGFEQRVRAAAAAEPTLEASENVDEAGDEQPVAPASVPEDDDIATQPHLTDEPSVEGAMAAPVLETTPAQPRRRRGFFRWLLLIVGVLLVVGAVAALVAFGILWYFYQTSPSQNF